MEPDLAHLADQVYEMYVEFGRDAAAFGDAINFACVSAMNEERRARLQPRDRPTIDRYQFTRGKKPQEIVAIENLYSFFPRNKDNAKEFKMLYFYWVRLTELEKTGGVTLAKLRATRS